jgi:hypothetical protein
MSLTEYQPNSPLLAGTALVVQLPTEGNWIIIQQGRWHALMTRTSRGSATLRSAPAIAVPGWGPKGLRGVFRLFERAILSSVKKGQLSSLRWPSPALLPRVAPDSVPFYRLKSYLCYHRPRSGGAAVCIFGHDLFLLLIQASQGKHEIRISNISGKRKPSGRSQNRPQCSPGSFPCCAPISSTAWLRRLADPPLTWNKHTHEMAAGYMRFLPSKCNCRSSPDMGPEYIHTGTRPIYQFLIIFPYGFW